MDRHDFRTQRLYVDTPLAASIEFEASRDHANYLLNVLRLKAGANILLFNGSDGEWLASLAPEGRKKVKLAVIRRTRPQTAPGSLWYLFAPLKHARLDYMVQKAVEMGVTALQPVITRHTQVARLNLERMRANVIEAAEQCGVLALAQVNEPAELGNLLADWDPSRRIVYCDESAEGESPLAQLAGVTEMKIAVLIGPEGGFSTDERAALRALPFVTPIALGPRILRADTAAVAALALTQSVLGDWKSG